MSGSTAVIVALAELAASLLRANITFRGEDEAEGKTAELLTRLDEMTTAGVEVSDATLALAAEIRALTNSQRDRFLGEAARQQNPAFRKPGAGPLAMLAALAIGAAAIVGCGGGHGCIQALPETETLRAGYSVVWPADASRDPEHAVTVVIDGELVTTVPVAFED